MSVNRMLAPAGGAVAPMADVAVIIPTHNRPQYLDEAIVSALRQSHPPKEIIVVDDGFAVPVDAETLRERHGATVRVLRNESNRGLAYSRNRGVEACSSAYVLHLDDDDLLAPEAIELCLQALQWLPQVELLMFAVQGFGPNAEHFNRVQPQGVDRVVALAGGRQAAPDIIGFDRALMPALLHTVPSAFQRVMTRTETWHRVSGLRRRAYRCDPAIRDDEAAKLAITGPLRDSEWAIYAAAACATTALIRRPLYLARCAGQGGSSKPSMTMAHSLQALSIKAALLRAATQLDELRPFAADIRHAAARAHFNASFKLLNSHKHGASLRHLAAAFRLHPQFRQIKLFARLVLATLARRRPVDVR